jgi:hypothetical protein
MTTSPEAAPTQSPEADNTPEVVDQDQIIEVENEDQNEQQGASPITLRSEALVESESNPFALFGQIKTAAERLGSSEDINDAVANYQYNVGLNLAKQLPEIVEERTGKSINVDPTEFHIDAGWWSNNVGSDGTYEEMAARFDAAYADFVTAKIDEILETALLSPDEVEEDTTDATPENTLPDAPEIEEAQNNFERYEQLTENNRALADKFRGRFVMEITDLMDNLNDIEQAEKDAKTQDSAKTSDVVSLLEQREAKLAEARVDLENVFKEMEAQAA